MATNVSYSYAREHFAEILDQVESTRDVTVIQRRGHEDMALPLGFGQIGIARAPQAPAHEDIASVGSFRRFAQRTAAMCGKLAGSPSRARSKPSAGVANECRATMACR